jgi:hypothetical protein
MAHPVKLQMQTDDRVTHLSGNDVWVAPQCGRIGTLDTGLVAGFRLKFFANNPKKRVYAPDWQ